MAGYSDQNTHVHSINSELTLTCILSKWIKSSFKNWGTCSLCVGTGGVGRLDEGNAPLREMQNSHSLSFYWKWNKGVTIWKWGMLNVGDGEIWLCFWGIMGGIMGGIMRGIMPWGTYFITKKKKKPKAILWNSGVPQNWTEERTIYPLPLWIFSHQRASSPNCRETIQAQ